MRSIARPLTPILYGDGVHDDTEALQVLIDGKDVMWRDGRLCDNKGSAITLRNLRFLTSRPIAIDFDDPRSIEISDCNFQSSVSPNYFGVMSKNDSGVIGKRLKPLFGKTRLFLATQSCWLISN